MSRLAFIATIVCATPAFADTAYFATIPDLPIAQGLQDEHDNWEFSGDGARAIGVSASGRAEAEDVRMFYQTALPALGWGLSIGSGGENETIYVRGREQLSLSFYQRGDEMHLEAILFVHPTPAD